MKKILILSLIVLTSLIFAFELDKNHKTDVDMLAQIDEYQTRYFTIVKRNNYFLEIQDDSKQDRKDLKNLYSEVKRQIKPNNKYFKKYKQNEHEYANSDVELETTVQMNDYAQDGYDKVDNLLNEVYQEIKAKAPDDKFQKLKTSQRKWLKEVSDYYNVFEAQEFGTIGTVIYYGYEMDMREFRTLLLILYLQGLD